MFQDHVDVLGALTEMAHLVSTKKMVDDKEAIKTVVYKSSYWMPGCPPPVAVSIVSPDEYHAGDVVLGFIRLSTVTNSTTFYITMDDFVSTVTLGGDAGDFVYAINDKFIIPKICLPNTIVKVTGHDSTIGMVIGYMDGPERNFIKNIATVCDIGTHILMYGWRLEVYPTINKSVFRKHFEFPNMKLLNPPRNAVPLCPAVVCDKCGQLVKLCDDDYVWVRNGMAFSTFIPHHDCI